MPESSETRLKAPFPYFGGKTPVAEIVWSVLGDVGHYMEPFFGSGAVLLARPDYDPKRHTETICEIDPFVANAWRGIAFAPEEVAEYCDWPVSHVDLSARKRRMLAEQAQLKEKMLADETYFDAKLAGYWVWAASCSIGGGASKLSQIPHLGDKGEGVHAQEVWTGARPHLSSKGAGVHAQEVRIGNDGAQPIYDYFRRLAWRLRHVRMVCGDWTRICGGNWQATHWDGVGIFFDPPYGVEDRDTKLYGDADGTSVAHDVRAWCLEHGARKSYRIVLAGYEEHQELLSHGWREYRWSAGGAYARKDSRGMDNRHRERLYFSPHCLRIIQTRELF